MVPKGCRGDQGSQRGGVALLEADCQEPELVLLINLSTHSDFTQVSHLWVLRVRLKAESS